jgi:hypothetical protein
LLANLPFVDGTAAESSQLHSSTGWLLMTFGKLGSVKAAAVAAVALVGGTLLASPASAMTARLSDTSARSCFDPAAVGAGARGGSARAADHRDISLREQHRIAANTKRILDHKAAVSATTANSKGNIPVYVHEMLSDSGAGNVSPTQIAAQITVLNETYGGADANKPAGTTVPSTGAHFFLAGSNEYRNSTWHADRQSTQYRAQTRQGGKNALNIWLVDFKYLGIATFPWDYAGSPGIDGIRVQYNSLPRTSSPAAGYQAVAHFDLGKTATHEAGHWLGLYHTFQGGCTATNDEVGDTPAQSSSTAGCPIGRDSCSLPGLDPIHNYMDYSYDSCYYEFTAGQSTRMNNMWNAYRA